VADELQLIPATLLSRCQRLRFSVPENSVASVWLQQQSGVTASEANSLLQMAEGAPLQALMMARNDYYALRNTTVQSLWQLLRGEAVATTVATTLLQHEVLTVFEVVFSVLFDVLRLSLQLPAAALNNQDCQRELRLCSEKIDCRLLAAWLPECLQAKARLRISSGLNVQLFLESLLIQWQKIGKAC
jgi:DNA polymerase-3 subunit delta'